jgi:hypothetical protein
MMSRLRLVIAWLVMAAVPLQGLAAATMVFCGGAHHGQAAQVSSAESGMHEHANGAEHDHAATTAASEDDGASVQAPASKALPDANHKCGVCSSCCSGVAIAQSLSSAAFMPLPQAELAEPFVLIHAPPSQLPDKPPRA